MWEQTVNSNTEGVTTHILAEVAINRVTTHQSNTLAEVAIDQSTGKSRHLIKPQAGVTINRDKTHQSNALAEVVICKPAQSAFFHLTHLNCDASVFCCFFCFFFIIFVYIF